MFIYFILITLCQQKTLYPKINEKIPTNDGLGYILNGAIIPLGLTNLPYQ
jgi:hypothetical protein